MIADSDANIADLGCNYDLMFVASDPVSSHVLVANE